MLKLFLVLINMISPLCNTYNNALNFIRDFCYKQTLYSVAESAFILFFARFMGGVAADRVLQN